jgi:hypothetical protein
VEKKFEIVKIPHSYLFPRIQSAKTGRFLGWLFQAEAESLISL